MTTPLGLFSAYGVELEYMLVDRQSLDVRPIADELLRDERGECVSELARGEACWSNELAAHLIEIKLARPAPRLEGLAELFQREVTAVNERLAPRGARLMPTAMHPWMDPRRQTRLWPHEYADVYRAFDQIFDCHTHGWANLQSVHLNLPFAGDEQFARLHAAVRVVLPLLPALAASSPLAEGRPSGWLDTRLDVYRGNARGYPAICGAVVPEPAASRAAYQREILGPIYEAIAPVDPHRVLQHEWLNARGAIARFDRGAIEIRVLDVQECPLADLAICALAAAVIELLAGGPGPASSPAALDALSTGALAELLWEVSRRGPAAVIDDPHYLALLGYGGRRATAGRLWRHLAEATLWGRPEAAAWRRPLEVIFDQGTLAQRILRAVGPQPPRAKLVEVYQALAECLAEGTMFEPAVGSG